MVIVSRDLLVEMGVLEGPNKRGRYKCTLFKSITALEEI